MTASAGIVSVRRVNDDVTECRRCGQPVARGRRVAFVTGTGNVCLHCLAGGAQDGETDPEPAP